MKTSVPVKLAFVDQIIPRYQLAILIDLIYTSYGTVILWGIRHLTASIIDDIDSCHWTIRYISVPSKAAATGFLLV